MTPKSKTPAWRRYVRFWGSNPEQDIDDELRFHIDMRAAEYVARGMRADDAQRLAEQRFGDADQPRRACVNIQEQHARSDGRTQIIAALHQDAVFAGRLLRRQLLPSVVAVLCLALGIGATTTMFSIGNTMLLRPLPYPNGASVLSILTIRNHERRPSNPSSYLDYLDLRARAHSFTDLSALQPTSFIFQLSTPVRAIGANVSSNFFRVLGVTPESGRLFTDDEDRIGGPRVVLVSHTFAETRLGGASGVVGKRFLLDGEQREVVGVIPDRMRYPSTGEAWAPLVRDPAQTSRASRNLDVYGALRPGMTADAAHIELTSLSTAFAAEHPKENTEIVFAGEPLRERYVGAARGGLLTLSWATALVLLVACTNVAALQIARATARAREIAVRSALGAARSRIMRQLLTESLILAAAGGALGVLITRVATGFVARAIATNAPVWMTFEIDRRALLFSVVISMLVGVASGIVPALRLARVDPSDVLRGGRGALGMSRGMSQRLLVIFEIALSVVLVVGAVLAMQSLVRLRRVPLGLDPTNVLVFRVALQAPRYDDANERARAIDDLRRRVAAIPGVRDVAATTYPPITGCCSQFGTIIEGRPTDEGHELMVTGNLVTPSFFSALRIPLVQGRDFTSSDDRQAPRVVIINSTFATRYWPSGDAIGHRIDTGSGMATIVGVVGDIKQARLIDPPEPQFYRAHLQDPWPAMTFTARVDGDKPDRIMNDVRRAVHDVDPQLPVYGVTTLEKMIVDVVESHRLLGSMFVAFALVALLLATAGVYASMSFFVSQRTREMGLRIALGAESRRVVGLVLRQGAVLGIAGGVAGLALGVVAARVVSHSLYGVSADEPVPYVVAVVTLLAAAVLACYGPARRASSVDPMVALRAE